jgi:2'-5' RNA ligase
MTSPPEPVPGQERKRSSKPRPTPATRRLFIAVPLPPSAIKVIEATVDAVRREIQDADSVRWVRLEGLHLTLRFLGRTEEATIHPLSALVDKIAASHDPFPVAIHEAGAFPSPARPRVLWLGIGEGDDALSALAHALEPGLDELGWSPEARPFRPHLTLARCDGVRAAPAVARALAAAGAHMNVRFDASRLVLFESRTGRGPAHYLAVHESRLGRHDQSAHADIPDHGDTIAAAGEPPRAGRKGALGAA